jgi:hypothetical protein
MQLPHCIVSLRPYSQLLPGEIFAILLEINTSFFEGKNVGKY